MGGQRGHVHPAHGQAGSAFRWSIGAERLSRQPARGLVSSLPLESGEAP